MTPRCAVCGLFVTAYNHVKGEPAYEHDADPAIPASRVRALLDSEDDDGMLRCEIRALVEEAER